MKPKKKYYLIGAVILLAAILGYHFYAASEAARQIDEALQERSQESDKRFSISYSAIEVHPFAGDIEFRDFNFTHSDYVHHSERIYFDLTYLNFLTIYLGGTEYGLKNINQLEGTITKPSVIFRKTVRELKGDALKIDYQGDIYDILRHIIAGVPLQFSHHLQTSTTHFRLTQQDSQWGNFAADSLYIKSDIPASATSFINAEQFLSKAIGINWTPPNDIQQQYGFFMRGFGYETDNIPSDSLVIQLDNPANNNRQMTLNLYTELFHAQARAGIKPSPNTDARLIFENGIVHLSETSEQFNNFLRNAEQLFGVTLPRRSEQLLQFSGPVSDPQISAGKGNR